MKRLDTKYFIQSHRPQSPVIEKNELISELEEYFFGGQITKKGTAKTDER